MTSSFKVTIRPLTNADSYSQGIEELGDDTSAHSEQHFSAFEKERPNILITLKNTETLDEYVKRTHIDIDAVPKIQKWINKRKFCVDETSCNELKLSIDKTFEFKLHKSLKSDAELIREELFEIKKEK